MTTPTILIVDDDPEITSALGRGLQLHGYNTLCESSVGPALIRFRDDAVSAAIVDVMIGRESGIDLVRAVRAEGNLKPVLMLSALSEVEDRALGLEAGANDYVVKPFSFDELVARMRVQERRVDVVEKTTFELDPTSRMVRGQGRQVILTEREYKLLEKLSVHQGSVLSRGEIFDDLWADNGTSSENIVDVYIGYLRKKLSPMGDFRFEIKTIRSRGFVLNEIDST
ncbi:MAG: response regulator transcription factor [Paracoccaceae bacterium]